ncbi:MAG: oxidoreductase, short chain dehydrogenase/reductase family [Deltaproteobacteria bacterium]|nr:oxidoreductase, short chain dehydrogenase/reductase family [Deltaproteobacteria bacterium]
MQSPLDMSGKVVIVTGAARGVGRGIVDRFLEYGADVIVCDIKGPDAPIAAGGREALYLDADITDVDQIDKVVRLATDRFGHLDVLINNAGGTPPVEAATASPRLHERIIRLNLISLINFCQRANTVMQAQENGGIIINMASVSGVRPSPGTAVYGAAKAGVINLTASLAIEWAPKVRINAISAGMILTEAARAHYGDGEGVAAVAATVPLGRLAMPEDVGDVCLFLASPLSSYITGASILMHGGGERPAFLAAAKNVPPR